MISRRHSMISYISERRNSFISIVSSQSYSAIPPPQKTQKPDNTIVTKPKDQWVDEIIQVFKLPEVKHHIDSTKGILTKRQSHKRIIMILTASGIMLALSAIILLSFCWILFKAPNTQTIKLNQSKPKVPHIFVLYEDGHHIDFSTDESISPSKDFEIKIPESNLGYFSYANLKYIYIFYADGKKDITYLNIETLQHRTIPNTTLTSGVHDGNGVQVGSRFMMSGDIKYYFWNVFSVESQTWSDKKERFVSSPEVPRPAFSSCFTPLNR